MDDELVRDLQVRDLTAALLTVAMWAGDEKATEDHVWKFYCNFRVRLNDLCDTEAIEEFLRTQAEAEA